MGGRLLSLSQSFVGPLAEAALERMSFDRVFLGADAADLDKFRNVGVAVEVAAVSLD